MIVVLRWVWIQGFGFRLSFDHKYEDRSSLAVVKCVWVRGWVRVTAANQTCGDRSSGGINDGGVEVGLAEGSCHTSSYSQHLPEGISFA